MLQPRPITVALLAAVLSLTTAAPAQTTWYVDDDTCPAMGDGSMGNPFCHLQDALAVAVAGDTIEMAAGTYGPPPSGVNYVNVGQHLTIAGAGADQTVIDFDGVPTADPIFVVLSDTTIRDLTIREGFKPSGSAGGIATSIGTVLVERCRIAANVAGNGGGGAVVAGGTTTFRDCLFDGNDAQNGGGGGALVQPAGTAHFINCTFAGNTATQPGGAVSAQSGATVTIENGIAWNDSPDELAEDDPGQITVTTAIIDGGWPGGVNVLDLDPQFTNATTGDFRLAGGSPAIDAGDNAPATASTGDLDGNARLADDPGIADTGTGTPPIVDLGAYERQDPSGPATRLVPAEYATIQAAVDASNSGDTIEISAGTYVENIVVPGGVSLTFIGPDGADATIVDGGGGGRCLDTDAPTTVEGMTFRNGSSASSGGNILALCGLTMRRCRVRDGVAAGNGGGIFCNDGLLLESCVIDNNTGGGFGGGGVSTEDCFIVNCTIVDNDAPSAAAVTLHEIADGVIQNSIIWGNDVGIEIDVETSLVEEDGDPDPLFADRAGGDFRPLALSPAIDAGDNAQASGLTLDYAGVPRFVDDPDVPDTGFGTPPIVDIGAYERQGPATLLVPDEYPTIQAAIDAALWGDTIEVAGDTYNEHLVIPAGRELTIISPDGAAMTYLSGGNVGRPLTTESSTTIEGFSFISGDVAGDGGGILALGDVTVKLRYCRVYWCDAGGDGGAIWSGGPVILENCLVRSCDAVGAGGAVSAKTVVAINTTIAGNAAGTAGAIALTDVLIAVLHNCIVWDNAGTSAFTGNILANNSIVQDGEGGGTNADPRFDGSFNHHLDRYSPAIDAGDNQFAFPYAVDLEGSPRFVDDEAVPDGGDGTPPIVDLGCNERQETSFMEFAPAPGELQSVLNQAQGNDLILLDGIYDESAEINTQYGTLVIEGTPGTRITGALLVAGSGNVAISSVAFEIGPSTPFNGFFFYPVEIDGPSVRFDRCSLEGTFSRNFTLRFIQVTSGEMILVNCVLGLTFIGLGTGPDLIHVDNGNLFLSNCNLVGSDFGQAEGPFPAAVVRWVSSGLLVMNNSIIYGNRVGVFPDESIPVESIIDSGSGPIVVNHSVVEGGWPGTGNLDVDPQTDGGPLSAHSPCIDAGNNLLVFSGVTTDFDGAPRFFDDIGVLDTGDGTPPIVDIGAYERQEASPPLVLQVPDDHPTVQLAIDAATPGGTVLIEPGVYNETLVAPADVPLTIRGLGGAEATIIDAGGAGAVLTASSDITLEDLTLRSGGSGDGAVHMDNGALTMERCVVTQCSAASANGVIWSDGDPIVLRECRITANTALAGTIVTDGSVQMRCTIIADNSGGLAGAARAGSILLHGCTIADNDGAHAFVILSGGTFDALASIIWDNTAGTSLVQMLGSGTATASGSIVQGGVLDGLDVDPLFTPAPGRYGLLPYSPGIDAASNDALIVVGALVDVDGNPRFVDDADVVDTGLGSSPIADLGAVERQADSAFIQVPQDYTTFQQAINESAPVQTILVTPGTYVERPIILPGRVLTIVGTGGADATILDGDGLEPTLTVFEDLTLEGLTITGGAINGGVYAPDLPDVDLSLVGCRITGNTSGGDGGAGIRCDGTVSLRNCLVDNNTSSGAGAGVRARVVVAQNTTFADNASPTASAIGITGPAPGLLHNCIVWGHGPGSVFDGSFSESRSIIEGGSFGGIDADPLFVAPPADYRVDDLSPAIDAGRNIWVSDLTVDYDGAPRFVDDPVVPDTGVGSPPIVDIGPFERQEASLAACCADDTCVNDCLCGSGNGTDCNGNGIDDDCEFYFGIAVDCDGNGVPDACDPDCDGNGMPDACDLAADPTLDCDGNGVIDACELADDPSLDCNDNGEVDTCDIAMAPALDCNGDWIIDACQVGGEGPCSTQPPSSGEHRSCSNGAIRADQFVLVESAVVRGVRLWGSAHCSGPLGVPPFFSIRVYDGGSDPTPGTELATFFCPVDVEVESAGVWRYEASLDALALDPGAYWIEIGSECFFGGVFGGFDCDWFWLGGNAGPASLPGSAYGASGPGSWTASGIDNYAFEVICVLQDCDNNLQIDACELAADPDLDTNGDGILDVCVPPCPGDTNNDGVVNVNDLNNVILDWGTDGSAHGGDLTGPTPGDPPDGIVNVNDLNAVIVGWGLCP